ncbi:hypothetical protein GLOTRDRAFT_39622, partial [Gloeophyllum trabeum ATCC 11539]
KCDKQIPCQSCVRRGCEILCPNDCFTTGQGTRSVIEATGHLYSQIKRLTTRNRELEEALASLQAKFSSEPHPLLQRDGPSSLASHSTSESTSVEDDPGDFAPELANSFGTLSISENGASRFIGPTGGSEVIVILYIGHPCPHAPQCDDEKHLTRPAQAPAPSLPDDVSRFSASFPFTPLGPPPAVTALIETYLPPWTRALALCDIYLEGAAWLFHAIPRSQLMDELLPAIYKRPSAGGTGPHHLALLFLVFAVGTLVDLADGPRDAEAEHYFQIASAAICLESVLERPSLVTVQAIHMMSIYNAMSPHGRDTSMETTWQLVALGSRLAVSVSIYRDSARWGLPYRMVQRRRFIFWDLFLADAWQSLASGRPPTFSLLYVDCKYPEDNDPSKDHESAGERECTSLVLPNAPSCLSSYQFPVESWGYRFAAECVTEIVEKVLGTTTPSYTTVMELDRKVRDFPMPQYATPMPSYDVRDPETGRLALAESMQRFCMGNIRETALLYIHRSFFAQAVIEHPEDPLKSRYATSFVSAYNASSVILNTISNQYEVCPDLVARFWTVWTYAFSAAVVFGTVVTRGPQSALAPSAAEELEKARVMFMRAARLSQRAAKALPVIVKLCEKARDALSQYRADSHSAPVGTAGSVTPEDREDELTIFAGHTRLVSTRRCDSAKVVPSERSVGQHRSAAYYDAQAKEMQPIALPVLPPLSIVGSSSGARQEEAWYPGYPGPDGSYGHSRPPHTTESPHYTPSPVSSWHPHAYAERRFGPGETMSELQSSSREAYQPQRQFTPQASYHPHYPAPPAELAELGLVSRASRLDERWTSFMQDSGVLDQNSFRST